MTPIEKNDFRDTVTSKALALIRWPLVMCIVAVHVFVPVTVTVGGEVYDVGASSLNMGLWRFVKGFISENGVATFFFISGFLFMTGPAMNREVYRSKVSRRVHSLLVPYVIWNVLALLCVIFVALPGAHASAGMSVGHMIKGFVMKNMLGYPHDAPLWFIRDLMVCIAVLPAMGLIMRRKWGWWMVVLLGAACFWLYTRPTSYPLLLVSALFFFYWGAYMASSGRDLYAVFRPLQVPCLVLYPLLGVIYMVVEPFSHEWAMIVKCCNLLVVIPLAVNIACWFVNRGCSANRFLTSATFFVFASHYVVLAYFRPMLVGVIRPGSEAGMLLTFVAGYFLLLGALLGIYFLLTRFTPRVARILTGKR